MSQTSIDDLIKALEVATDHVEKLRDEVLNICEKSFCDALREHSDLSEPAIRQAWLSYCATNLRFEV